MDLDFLIHSEYLCMLTGVFITFTFNVIINIVGLNLRSCCFLCTSIFLFLFPSFFSFSKKIYFYDSTLPPFWLITIICVILSGCFRIYSIYIFKVSQAPVKWYRTTSCILEESCTIYFHFSTFGLRAIADIHFTTTCYKSHSIWYFCFT